MQVEDFVKRAYPDAQVEEHYYGTGTRRIWKVYDKPWSNVLLGDGFSAQEAWNNAAMTIRED